MTSPQKISSEEIAARLKSVLDYVQDCDRRVSKGEIMDLQGLDKNVIILCDAIASLPQKEALAFENDMARLIEKLEVLAESMKTQQENFSAAGGR
jgi:hypothetical protein